jgi:hypothetical protein
MSQRREVYMGAVGGILWLANMSRPDVDICELLVDLGVAPLGPSQVFSDFKSAVNMSFDLVAFKKTKHILRVAAFLRDLVAKGLLVLHHVKGAKMMADILTKPTARTIIARLLHLVVGGIMVLRRGRLTVGTLSQISKRKKSPLATVARDGSSG